MLKGDEVKEWLKPHQEPADDSSFESRNIQLFLSDRPFHWLKTADSALTNFDYCSTGTAEAIASVERNLASEKCRFLCRVSNDSEELWRKAYRSCQQLYPGTDFMVCRNVNKCRGSNKGFRRADHYRYLHYGTCRNASSLYVCPQSDFESFWGEDNTTAKVDCFMMTGVCPSPKRHRLTSSKATLGDTGVSPTGEPVRKFHRYEVHMFEMCDLIQLFAPFNSIVVDSTAGSCSTAMAALRMGRKCICVEKDKHLVDLARKRLELCYQILNDEGVLPADGAVAHEPPTHWEEDGRTWMHRAQYSLKLRREKAERAGVTQAKRVQSAEAKRERVSSLYLYVSSSCSDMLCAT